MKPPRPGRRAVATGKAVLRVAPNRQELVATAAPLIQTIAFGMPALAVIQIFTGTLRGSGDTRVPLLVTFFGFLVVRIPLTYLLTSPADQTVFFGQLSGWEIGVQGAWCAMVTDLYLRSVPLVYRFFQGGWQRVKV